MNKILIVLLLGVALTGCAGASIDETLGITAADNAMQCVEAEVSTSNPFAPGRIRTKRVELPADFDSSKLTLESVQELMNWCD